MTWVIPVSGTIRAIAILVAFGIDHFLGEPPAHFHPVVWIGKALSSTCAPWVHATPQAAFTRGLVAWTIGAALASGAAWLAAFAIDYALEESSSVAMFAQGILIGILLKPLLAWRMLCDEVAAVERALQGGLDAGRTQLKRLVSRDTTQLKESEVRESALESLAENLNDSLIAALFWFAIGGLPAAALYRFANTTDAMWGYRGRWEWAGKWAARADDLLSYIPARLTAMLLALAAWRWPAGLPAIARVTPSPNGGWPMGMLAIALNVRLSKPGVYVLNAVGAAPHTRDVFVGLQICRRAAWFAIAASVMILTLIR